MTTTGPARRRPLGRHRCRPERWPAVAQAPSPTRLAGSGGDRGGRQPPMRSLWAAARPAARMLPVTHEPVARRSVWEVMPSLWKACRRKQDQRPASLSVPSTPGDRLHTARQAWSRADSKSPAAYPSWRRAGVLGVTAALDKLEHTRLLESNWTQSWRRVLRRSGLLPGDAGAAPAPAGAVSDGRGGRIVAGGGFAGLPFRRPAWIARCQGVGSTTAAPKISELPNVAGQSACGAGLGTGVPVRSDSRHASMAGQSAPLRTSFQTPTAPPRVAAVYT